ncbi:MAG: mechanosensitive ion channel [Gammaproteobacteria bacterium]|nr:mechanosensitive ion channel [Gammaproteobacteria bacterium]
MKLNQLLRIAELPDAAIPLSVWVGISFIVGLTSAIFYVWGKKSAKEGQTPRWLAFAGFVLEVTKKPLLFLLISYGLYMAVNILSLTQTPLISGANLTPVHYLFGFIEFIAFFWLVFNILRVGKLRVWQWADKNNHTLLQIFIPAIGNSIQAVVFLLMLTMLIPMLNLSGAPGIALEKAAKVILIGMIGWISVQMINVLEKIIIRQYSHDQNPFTTRKINTQVVILKRVVLAIVFTITLAAILMIFDSVKNIGAGLLTTAGIVSAVGAFASQQSLGRLFAGLQIAFTQPIRIGDTVVIENEFGQVEEITLSYIVVKLWDLRRLILPTDYFTSKGLLNLTRNTTQLLGTVFLHTDYTLPIETIRQKFNEFLTQSKLWDGKVSAFQVTEMRESTMEIRALVSAENASILWNLRCEIREKLITFISEHYPECLTKTRSLTTNVSAEPELEHLSHEKRAAASS